MGFERFGAPQPPTPPTGGSLQPNDFLAPSALQAVSERANEATDAKDIGSPDSVSCLHGVRSIAERRVNHVVVAEGCAQTPHDVPTLVPMLDLTKVHNPYNVPRSLHKGASAVGMHQIVDPNSPPSSPSGIPRTTETTPATTPNPVLDYQVAPSADCMLRSYLSRLQQIADQQIALESPPAPWQPTSRLQQIADQQIALESPPAPWQPTSKVGTMDVKVEVVTPSTPPVTVGPPEDIRQEMEWLRQENERLRQENQNIKLMEENDRLENDRLRQENQNMKLMEENDRLGLSLSLERLRRELEATLPEEDSRTQSADHSGRDPPVIIHTPQITSGDRSSEKNCGKKAVDLGSQSVGNPQCAEDAAEAPLPLMGAAPSQTSSLQQKLPKQLRVPVEAVAKGVEPQKNHTILQRASSQRQLLACQPPLHAQQLVQKKQQLHLQHSQGNLDPALSDINSGYQQQLRQWRQHVQQWREQIQHTRVQVNARNHQ